jgi:hypothetical protein
MSAFHRPKPTVPVQPKTPATEAEFQHPPKPAAEEKPPKTRKKKGA